MTSKIHDDIRKFVMTSQIHHDITKFIMTSNKFVMTSQIRHDLKYVMTSKSLSLRQKVHDVKHMTSKSAS